jgi:uncharacterized protein YbbC (DUF1343 family)
MLIETRRASGANWSWAASHFDRLAGTDALRLGLERGDDLDTLTSGWRAEISSFQQLRASYLLYQ